MTHAEARELLELAAAEPGGLARLAAGDTADSGVLAGHLAGCDGCREEYGRLSRTAGLLRSNLSTLPPPDLRERTLARIAAEGRVRTASAAGTATGGSVASMAASGSNDGLARTPPEPVPLVPRASGVGRRTAVAWLGSLAAAVALAVGLSWAVVARPLADQARDDRETAAALSQLTAATLSVDTQVDARHVTLASTSNSAVGQLTFSPTTRELVVVSTGLAAPVDGAEYRCWVESNGTRTILGKMYLVGSIAAWEGWSDAVANVPAGARFGISLAPAGGGAAEPVLTGTLSGA